MSKPTIEQISNLRDECYNIAKEHGFHDVELPEEHWMCLVITELSEAVEADRKDRHADLKSFNEQVDAACYNPIEVIFEAYIKDTVEDELADAAIRILDLAGAKKWDIGWQFHRAEQARKNSDGEWPSFTQIIYELFCQCITCPLGTVLYSIFEVADYYKIDLMKHIRLKMEYNKTRNKLHGKKY